MVGWLNGLVAELLLVLIHVEVPIENRPSVSRNTKERKSVLYMEYRKTSKFKV